MEDDIQNPDTQGAARRPLSCDRCRRLKIKCLRPEQGKPCSKCAQTQQPCKVSHRRAPQGTSKITRPRIADLDAKLHGILKLLSHADDTRDSNNTQPSTSSDGSQVPDFEQTCNSQPETRPASASTTLTNSPTLGLSNNALQYLLDGYRKHQAYFPFVVIPAEWSVAYMAAERPFLLLAVTSCLSVEYPHFQAALTEQFKKILAARALVNGERNLDLLQGLLVHLSWAQFSFQPRSQQVYQYQQLANSLVTDLNLDDDPINLLESRQEIFLQHQQLRDNPASAIEIATLEAQRAYLGCQYLSSMVSYFLGKPNRLHPSVYALRCAEYISQIKEYATDESISYIINLQQLADEVNETYRRERSTGEPRHLMVLAEQFAAKIEHWRQGLPFEIQDAELLELRYHAVRIMIYEVGLVHRFGRQRTTGYSEHVQDFSDTSLIGTLQACLDAALSYLDCFLQLSSQQIQHIPFDEWIRLTLAFFVVYKLSSGLPEVPAWHPDMAKNKCDLDQYLSTLHARLNSHPWRTTGSFGTMFHMYPAILKSAKTSSSLLREYPSMFSQGIQVHGTEPDDAVRASPTPSLYTSCPGFRHIQHPAPSSSADEDNRTEKKVAAEIMAIESMLV